MSDWSINPTVEERYLQACEEAATDDSKFAVFKQNKDYQVILEHISVEDGSFYFDLIEDKAFFNDNYERFLVNDEFGTPDIWHYPFGTLSPSTARYTMNTCNIHSNIGDKFGKVVEIGGGYGGLALTMSSVLDVDQYVLIDHDKVNMLSQRYLSRFTTRTKFSTINYLELEEIKDVDLVVSNYALSELTLALQTEYYDKVITNANSVYFAYNFIHPEAGVSFDTLMARLQEDEFKVTLCPERYNNQIVCAKR